ncbi:unnamed protein product [Cylindrotheca closterium]|uniref:Uncharacterized protein n=1 Tax=Cylindrotheca closterium TaxID=2856 RepID=A0AAD2FPC5_9STRA|nr:unnamed protein product [Cylindrotheca closterium]
MSPSSNSKDHGQFSVNDADNSSYCDNHSVSGDDRQEERRLTNSTSDDRQERPTTHDLPMEFISADRWTNKNTTRPTTCNDITAQRMIPLVRPPPSSLFCMMSSAPKRLRYDASPEERIEYSKSIIDEALGIIHGRKDDKLASNATMPQRQ